MDILTIPAKFFAWRANSSVAWLYNYPLIAVELYFTSPENLATIYFMFHLCSSHVNLRVKKIAQHVGKNGKRETVGVAPSVALIIIFVFQIALCDDPFIMAVVHYPASHLALSFILTSA